MQAEMGSRKRKKQGTLTDFLELKESSPSLAQTGPKRRKGGVNLTPIQPTSHAKGARSGTGSIVGGSRTLEAARPPTRTPPKGRTRRSVSPIPSRGEESTRNTFLDLKNTSPSLAETGRKRKRGGYALTPVQATPIPTQRKGPTPKSGLLSSTKQASTKPTRVTGDTSTFSSATPTFKSATPTISSATRTVSSATPAINSTAPTVKSATPTISPTTATVGSATPTVASVAHLSTVTPGAASEGTPGYSQVHQDSAVAVQGHTSRNLSLASNTRQAPDLEPLEEEEEVAEEEGEQEEVAEEEGEQEEVAEEEGEQEEGEGGMVSGDDGDEEAQMKTPRTQDLADISYHSEGGGEEKGESSANAKSVPRKLGKGRVVPKELVSSGNVKKNPPRALPRTLMKNLFMLFSKRRLTRGAMDVVMKFHSSYLKQATTDLTAYSRHAGRKSITMDDAVLLLTRQRAINKNHSFEDLVQSYLPMEYAEELLQ